MATYTYSATGRRVINRDRRGVHVSRRPHRAGIDDRFDLYRWARQALGIKGLLLGWLPPVQGAIRRKAAQALAAWRAKENAADRAGAGPTRT